MLALVAGGGCEFQLTEEMFNHDYPGHYFRVIKTMAILVKVAVGPYQSIKATLVQVGSKALLEPSIDAVRYLMGDECAEQPNGNVVRTNWRANQQIAISKTNVDYGMFVLNFFLDDHFFPVEGTGTAPYDADQKFQILVTPVEAILTVENVQWAESTTAKRKAGAAGAVTLPARNSSERASSS